MRPLGLRTRITLVFALGALGLSVLLAGSTYELTRQSLLAERERAAIGVAYTDASLLTQGLAASNPNIVNLLTQLNAGDQRTPLLLRRGQTFGLTSTTTDPSSSIPPELRAVVSSRQPGIQPIRLSGGPGLAVGIPLPDGSQLYELNDLSELRRTLAVLATVLALVSVVVTLAAAAVGRAASRRALRPLTDVAGAAGSIASGDLSARVARDRDPDLDALAVAFNAMVDEVTARSAADRRFAADVSHELRSPLQTLTAVTSVLHRRRAELDSRTQAAVDLLSDEVFRFSSLVTDLLELARADRPADRRPIDIAALTRALVTARTEAAIDVEGEGRSHDVDPRRYEQLLVNLLDNAAKYGGGATRVGLDLTGAAVRLEVDDEGAGVPETERELIFNRFARGRASSARGGSDGTGLGLAIVSQHAAAHTGSVAVSDRPGGGARFTVVLPATAHPATLEQHQAAAPAERVS